MSLKRSCSSALKFVVVWDEKQVGPEGAKEHPDHLGGC